MPESSLPCLALAGPTASGKTGAALALARHSRSLGGPPVELISVDSALVYRGMDIGTAKPRAAELAEVPHHLIDIREPTQAYSAAEFVADAQRLIGQIQARGAWPVLVGGTMLYFKALFEGLDALPAANPAIRAALDARARREGWPALHAALAEVDPVTAARLAPLDAQRIQRALEVWELSGQPLSSFHSGRFGLQGQPAQESVLGQATPLFSLEPQDRAWLHQRIAQRFDAMLAGGFVQEMLGLHARGDLHPELPSMRCVGYRQAWAWLEGEGDDTLLRERSIAATRQLAKRQLTWLRSMPQRRIIPADHPQAEADFVAQAWACLPT